MNKKHIFRTLPFALVSLAIGLFMMQNQKTQRDAYEDFILEKASVMKGVEMKSTKGLKTPDKPDEAAFHEYLMTVDPALGYVPKERLYNAYEYTKAKIEEQKSFRYYEPQIEWEQTGANMGGRTRMIMFDPNDPQYEKVWAGGVTGGLWYNDDITDAGEEWVPVGDFWSNISISCMAYDPNNTETFYLGTGEAQTARIIYRESSGVGAGIFKSTDAGQTWELMDSTSSFKYITDMIVRDENGVSVIYAAVASGTYMGVDHESQATDGLYRSDDGGLNWEQVLPVIPGFTTDPYTPADIELATNGRIFVGTMENLNGLGGATVLYSDEGKPGSWTAYDYYNIKISNESYYKVPARTIVASAPSNPDKVYAQFAAGYNDGAFRYYRGRYMAVSNDGGDTWEQISRPDSDWSTLAWHAFILKVDPSNENTIFTGGLDLWRSGNSGTTWNHVSDWALMYYGGGDEYVHADQHNIQYQPGNPTTSIFSSDGGVFLTHTANQGFPVFMERNRGYNTLQFYSGAISPTPGAKKYIGGLQDNGSLYYNGSPLDINDMIQGGDGALCFWDQNESGIFITSSYYNNYRVWFNGDADGFGGNSGTFVSPADYDYKTNILYSNAVSFTGANKNKLLRSSGLPYNINDQFITLGTNSDVAFSNICYSRFSTFGTSTLFVGTQSGKLFRVDNAESQTPLTFEIGSPDFPTANISCIALGNVEDVMLVTFSNYGVSSVWLTKDGGETWEEKESNLPDMPIRWAVFHPDNNEQVMLATETGMWLTNTLYEDVPDWAPGNEGLANVRTDMLRIRYADDVVLAATHGRGLATADYELDLYVGEEENLENESSVTIFPNPVKDKFKLTAGCKQGAEISILITDMSGKIIIEQTDIASSDKYNKDFDFSDLSPGLYFVTISFDGKSETKKVIVQ